MELLIKNVRIVDSYTDFVGDVYIEKGIIKEVGTGLQKSCSCLNGEGCTLLPSFIDLHSHFRDPGLTYKEDLYTGSRAAIRGGYTAVNLMANTKPLCSSMEVVNYVKEKAKEINLIHINQTLSITEDMKGTSIEHLNPSVKEVKFISEDGKEVASSRVMLLAMGMARELDLTVMSHAEDEELTPICSRLSENLMTWRNIELAKHADCKLHMAHVSTVEAMQYVIEGKREGMKLTCEVAPHHIYFTKDTEYKVNPPLREQKDVDFLIEAIKSGWVDAIATDHAPHSPEDKLNGAPGISGLETAFSACYTKLVREGHITLNKLSSLMSKRPAEIMNLKKGLVAVGYDGDLVLVDTEKEYKVDTNEFESKGKNTPFQGETLQGKILTTIAGGRVLFDCRDNGGTYHDNR